MDERIILVALAGLLTGAGAALWISVNAPRLVSQIALYSVAALLLLPFVMSFSDAHPIKAALRAAGDRDAFETSMWASFFVLSARWARWRSVSTRLR